MSGPFAKHARFVVRAEEPFNGGPPLELLGRETLTPVDLFYVRNHAGVPVVDVESFRLVVDGLVGRSLALSIAGLEAFGRREVEAVMPCAGNRRLELMEVAPIPGELPWGSEAASNASWSGFALADVLREAGVRESARHVAFEGLDVCERQGMRFGFGGSIPLRKALREEVLLADRMNGEPLWPIHGAPLRSVVPGYIGARSVKWLSRITLRDSPSDNYFQQRAYRLLPPEAAAGDAAGPMLGEFPVNALVTDPAPGRIVPAGKIGVRGVALAGGGRRIVRVDLSGDGGRTWSSAAMEEPRSRWAWTRFEGTVTIPPGDATIVARAWDEAAQGQPERPSSVWNAKGYANNSWFRVPVRGLG